MRYVVLDLVLALLALVVLGLLGLRLWRRVKTLGSAVSQAGDALDGGMRALELAQARGPLAAGRRIAPSPGRAAPTGVRSQGRHRR